MQAESQDLKARLDFAVRIAGEAGERTLRHFRDGALLVERKQDDSPVTVADREAEEHLRAEIERGFSEDGILGEEFGESPGRSGFRWILDPIDGTKSFIHGVPLYTTLVGVEHANRGVVGVIFAPATGEMAFAAMGHGAWYSNSGETPQPAAVSQVGEISEALLLTSEVASFRRHRKVDATEAFLRLQDATRLSRTWGDAYGYLMVATGRAEIMIDPIMSVWDAAAVQPILEEAGGRFTDWQGEPTIYSGEGVATNGHLHEHVLAITRGA